MSFPWESWCQFCRKTTGECSVASFFDLRTDESLFEMALKSFSKWISRRAETMPTCPDCHTFILELQQFSEVCTQTHSIYSELRKKCQPERYRADLEDQEAQEMEQRQLIEEQEAQEKADQEEPELEEQQIHIEEIVAPENALYEYVICDEEVVETKAAVLEAQQQQEPPPVTHLMELDETSAEEKEDEELEEVEIKPVHTRKKTKLEDFTCEVCGQVWLSAGSLKRHMRVHVPKPDPSETSTTDNTAKFFCEDCGKPCKTKGALKEHMVTHSDDRPLQCGHCPKTFKNMQRLKLHEDTHNSTAYVCPICGLNLNTRRTLNMHMVVHSEVKQFKCEFCGNEYKRAKALKSHLVIHTGLKPYSCPFCTKTFTNGSNCRMHKRKAHPEELAELEAEQAAEAAKTERSPAAVKKVLPSIKELKTNLKIKSLGSAADQLVTILPYHGKEEQE